MRYFLKKERTFCIMGHQVNIRCKGNLTIHTPSKKERWSEKIRVWNLAVYSLSVKFQDKIYVYFFLAFALKKRSVLSLLTVGDMYIFFLRFALKKRSVRSLLTVGDMLRRCLLLASIFKIRSCTMRGYFPPGSVSDELGLLCPATHRG